MSDMGWLVALVVAIIGAGASLLGAAVGGLGSYLATSAQWARERSAAKGDARRHAYGRFLAEADLFSAATGFVVGAYKTGLPKEPSETRKRLMDSYEQALRDFQSARNSFITSIYGAMVCEPAASRRKQLDDLATLVADINGSLGDYEKASKLFDQAHNAVENLKAAVLSEVAA